MRNIFCMVAVVGLGLCGLGCDVDVSNPPDKVVVPEAPDVDVVKPDAPDVNVTPDAPDINVTPPKAPDVDVTPDAPDVDVDVTPKKD